MFLLGVETTSFLFKVFLLVAVFLIIVETTFFFWLVFFANLHPHIKAHKIPRLTTQKAIELTFSCDLTLFCQLLKLSGDGVSNSFRRVSES